MERILALLFLHMFFIMVTSGQHNVCSRPALSGNIETIGLQRFFNPGMELVLTCKLGFTPVLGPRKIVCSVRGEWTKTKLMCLPKRCPYPNPLANGEMYYEDTVYQSTINYTCNEGYTLVGANSAECLASATWSAPEPECKPVTCELAPIPQFGMIVYNKKIRGNVTLYGVTATYRCLPPYALIGNPNAQCTANRTWTKMPKCQVVTCPPPENIERGYVSGNDQTQYDFMETVKYGCHEDFVLEGNHQSVCQDNGMWSEKPSCKAPCQIGIQRARILYQEKKVWIKDLTSKKLLHKELVSVYCKDQARGCGYAVPTQCIDGIFTMPECFEEPSSIDYNNATSLPSEIVEC